jgi:hypothetical protein
LRWLFAILAALWLGPAGAQTPLLSLHAGPQVVSAAPTYNGLGNIITSATAYYGLRAYSSSQLGGTTKSVNLKRLSDSTACDFDINTSGNLGGTDSGCSLGGGESLATFATTDATATCTISTTTATCTGASSTPHVSSNISGAGLTQPCFASAVGTFTGAAGTVTLSGNSTAASPCGTVSVGETLTFTYGLAVTEVYDQTGNGNNLAQASSGQQPTLLPSCINSLPCLSFIRTANQYVSAASLGSYTQPNFASVVGVRSAVSSAQQTLFSGSLPAPEELFVAFSGANNLAIYAGTSVQETLTDGAWHALQGEFHGTTSAFNYDGTDSGNVSAGTAAWTSTWWLGADGNGDPLNGFIAEAALWEGITTTSTQRGNLCHNEYAYWGTSTSC